MTALLGVLGLISLLWLGRTASAQDAPLIPVDLLRLRVLRLSYGASICGFGAQMIGLISLPFSLQDRFGNDHMKVGLLITTLPIGVIVAAPLAARLSDRLAAGLLGGIGMGMLACGYGLVALSQSTGVEALIIPAVALCGFGFGTFQTPNNRVMIGSAPLHRSGAAGGMLATARLIGQTLGALVAAMIFRLEGTASILPFIVAATLGVLAAFLSASRSR